MDLSSEACGSGELLHFAASWSQLRPQLLSACSASQGLLLDEALLVGLIGPPKGDEATSSLPATIEARSSSRVLCPLSFSPSLSIEQFVESIDFLCEIRLLGEVEVQLVLPRHVADPLGLPGETIAQLTHSIQKSDALVLFLPSPTAMSQLQDGEWNWQVLHASLECSVPLWITCSKNVLSELLSFLIDYGPSAIHRLIASPPSGLPASCLETSDLLSAKLYRSVLHSMIDFLQCVVRASQQLQPSEQAVCWHAIGEMLVLAGQFSVAEEHFRLCLSLCHQGSPSSPSADWAMYALSLAQALLHRQDYVSAEPLLQQVYDLWSRRMHAPRASNGSDSSPTAVQPWQPESLPDGAWRLVLHHLVRCYLHDGRVHLAQAVYLQYLHSHGYDLLPILPEKPPVKGDSESQAAVGDRQEVQEAMADMLRLLCLETEAEEGVEQERLAVELEDPLSPLEESSSPTAPPSALSGDDLRQDQEMERLESWEEVAAENEMEKQKLDAIPPAHHAGVLDALQKLTQLLTKHHDWHGAWQTLRHGLFLQRRALLLQGEEQDTVDKDASILAILQAMALLCMRQGRSALAESLWEEYIRRQQPHSSVAMDETKAVSLLTAHYHLAQLAVNQSESSTRSRSGQSASNNENDDDPLLLDKVWTHYQACLPLCLAPDGGVRDHKLVLVVLTRMLRILSSRLARAKTLFRSPIPPTHIYHQQVRQLYFHLIDYYQRKHGGIYHEDVLQQISSFVQYCERHDYVDESLEGIFFQAIDIQAHFSSTSSLPPPPPTPLPFSPGAAAASSYELSPAASPASPPSLAGDFLYRLARLYRKCENDSQAIKYYIQFYQNCTAQSPLISPPDRLLLCHVLQTTGVLLHRQGGDPQQTEDFYTLAWRRCQEWLDVRHPLRAHVLQTLVTWHSQRQQHADTLHYCSLLFAYWKVNLRAFEDASSSPLISADQIPAVVSMLRLYAHAAEAFGREKEAMSAYKCIIHLFHHTTQPADAEKEERATRDTIPAILHIIHLLAHRPDRNEELLHYAGLAYKYYLPHLRSAKAAGLSGEREGTRWARIEGAEPVQTAQGESDDNVVPRAEMEAGGEVSGREGREGDATPVDSEPPSKQAIKTAIQIATLYADELFADERYREAQAVYAVLYDAYSSSLTDATTSQLPNLLSYSRSFSSESISPMSVSQHGRDPDAEDHHSACVALLFRRALCCQRSQQFDLAERLFLECIHQSGFSDITYESAQHVDIALLPVWIIHPRSSPSPPDLSPEGTSYSQYLPTLITIVSALTQLYAMYRSQARYAQAVYVLHFLYDLHCQHYRLHGTLLSANSSSSTGASATVADTSLGAMDNQPATDSSGEAASVEVSPTPAEQPAQDTLWELGSMVYALGTLYIKCADQFLTQPQAFASSPTRSAGGVPRGFSPPLSSLSPLPPGFGPPRSLSSQLASNQLAMDSVSISSSLSTIRLFLPPQTNACLPDYSAQAPLVSPDLSPRLEDDGPSGLSPSRNGDGASDGEDSELTILDPSKLQISNFFHLADHYFHQHLLLVYPSNHLRDSGHVPCRLATFHTKVQTLTTISNLFVSVQHAVRAVPYLEACYDTYQQPWEGKSYSLDRQVASVLQSLLTQYSAMGADEKIDRTFQRLIDFYTRKYSPHDLLVLKTFLHHGHVLFSRNQLDLAMEQYVQARNRNLLYDVLQHSRFSSAHSQKATTEDTPPPPPPATVLKAEGEEEKVRALVDTPIVADAGSSSTGPDVDSSPRQSVPLLASPPSTMTSSLTQSASSSPVLLLDPLLTNDLVRCIAQLEQSTSSHLQEQGDSFSPPEDRSCQSYLVLLMQSLLHCGRCAQRVNSLVEAEEDYLLALQVYHCLALSEETSPLSPLPISSQSSLVTSVSPLSHVGGGGREEYKELQVLIQHNLAVLYVKTQQYAKAEELFQAVYQHKLSLSSISLPALSPDTMSAERQAAMETAQRKGQLSLGSAMNDLAGVLTISKKYAEAEPLYARIYEMRLALLGSQHSDSLLALLNLAFIEQKLGRFAEAKRKYEECLTTSLEVLGEHHAFIEKVRSKFASLEIDRRHALRASRLPSPIKGDEKRSRSGSETKQMRPTPLSLMLPQDLHTPTDQKQHAEMGCCCTN